MRITLALIIGLAVLAPAFASAATISELRERILSIRAGHAASIDADARSRIAGMRERYRRYPTASQQTPAAQPPAGPPTVTASPPSTTSSQSHNDASFALALAQSIHQLTNAERSKAGLPALQWDDRLAKIADAHSEDMAAKGYFSHTNKAGCNSPCRLKNAGYAYWYMGENIAWIGGRPKTDALAAQFVTGWMNSPGHRANILSGNFTHEGLGIAIVGSKVYATANFAQPR